MYKIINFLPDKRYLITVFLVCISAFINGCVDENSQNTINLSKESSGGGFSLPKAIANNTINTDNVSAFIIFDNGEGSIQREPMKIVGDRAEFTKAGLSAGTYTISIEFQFTDTSYTNVILALASHSNAVLSTGVSTGIAFLQEDFNYPDDDGDNVFNIIEIGAGTDPADNNDSPELICSSDAGLINCLKTTFQVGGTVLGLEESVVLQINGGLEQLTIMQQDSNFVFETALVEGSSYSVSIARQPDNPVQKCVVANGDGVITSADITGIVINCTTSLFTIGGSISGLSGNGLAVRLNENNNLIINNGSGNYIFPSLMSEGESFTIAIINQPVKLDQICSLSSDKGIVGKANVINVNINCVTSSYVIGGAIDTLEGSGLVLQNNNETLTVSAGESVFSFINEQVDGSGYNITVLNQPSVPDQICTLSNSTGNVRGSNVTGVKACCRRADNQSVVNVDSVFDPVTGLTWQRDWEPNDYNWVQAIDRCEVQGLRLPTRVELESIVDARFKPAWMSCTFRGDGLSAWSSTVVGSQSAFVVHFSSGGTGNDIQQNRYSVRCVKGP